MSTKTSVTIRPATMAASDHELLVDFRDSQIAWLSSMGSGDQWGTKSSRQSNPTVSDRTRAWIERSEKKAQWSSDWCRAFIAEADGDSVPIAGLVLDSKAPAYVRAVLPEQDEDDPFVYLAYLISNRDAGEKCKGSGATLITFAKDQVRDAGLKRICLDCWRGNDRKLVK
jgi:hypothetical protein